MVFAVTQFDGSNLPRLGVKSEIVVKAPPVIAQSFLDLEARHNFVVVTRHIRDLDSGEEVGFTVSIVGFGEHPGELEASLNDDHRITTVLKADRGVEVGDGDVVRASGHNRLWKTIDSFSEGNEQRRFIVIEITSKGDLNVLDVLPPVDITELDLGRVRNARVEGFVIVVSEDGRIAQVDLRLELLADVVGHQVSIPIRKDFAGTVAASDGRNGANRAFAHGNFIVLLVLP